MHFARKAERVGSRVITIANGGLGIRRIQLVGLASYKQQRSNEHESGGGKAGYHGRETYVGGRIFIGNSGSLTATNVVQNYIIESKNNTSMAYEVQNFQEEVIKASYEKPVVVDFWAPWCGPCRVLGPVIEKLAHEDDRWSLIKVNTDQHQNVSRQYSIRGIPAVKLFVDGSVVDEFTGALPEYAIRQWLDKALPTANKARVSEAETALELGDLATAEQLLEAALVDEPNNAQARAMLARIIIFRDPARAAELAQAAASGEPRFVLMGEAVKTLATFLVRDTAVLPEDPIRITYAAALEATRAQVFDSAVLHIIEVLQQNRYYDDDGARKLGIALFNFLGPEHPVTRQYRRTFDMWLY